MAVSQTPAKKTAAKKTTTKAATPTPEKGSEVTPEEVEQVEQTSPGIEPGEGTEGEVGGEPVEISNDAAKADASEGTPPEDSGDEDTSDPQPGEPDEDEESSVDGGSEGEQPLDSAQLAALATSADRAQMVSAEQARDYAAALAPEKDDDKATSQRAVAKRDRESMDAELTAGRTTPAAVIESVGADGHKAGTGPGDTLAPVDRSGLHGPSQDALNPAFAIVAD